jgi:hypothetical protein
MSDGQINDGLVIAESAYNGCKLFITKRQTILKAKRDSIQISLIGSDLAGVLVVSPVEMLAVFKEIEKQST